MQDLTWDVPDSNYDWFECIYYPDGCGPESEVEHYVDYFNLLSPISVPQTCDGPEKYCIGQRGSKIVTPGYSTNASLNGKLDNQANAKTVFVKGFTDAHIPEGTYTTEFLKIPKSKVTNILDLKDDVYVIVARYPRQPSPSSSPGPSPSGVLYFGLQIEKSEGPLDHDLNNENCQHATQLNPDDKKIRVQYKIGGEQRVAVIWLK